MKHVNCDKLMVRLNGMEKMDGLLKGITEACLLVQKAAVGNCPVDMGELQGTITIVEPKPGREPAGIVGTNKEYAPYVELGTGLFAVNGDGRQDVLATALQDNVDGVKKLIAAGIRGDL